MPLGGANPSNAFPGYNSSRPGSNSVAPFNRGGNSTPSGKGSGTWVSGQHSSRSDRSNRGGATPTPGKRPRGSGRGSRPKKGVRGNTATSKPLGGSGIPGATPTGAAGTFSKGGIYGLAAYIFVRILFGNQNSAITTVPEHLRQPGEQEKLREGDKPPWYGGQNPNTSYQLDYQKAIISGGTLVGWGNASHLPPQGITSPFQGVRLLISGVDYGVLEHWGFRSVGSDNPPPNGSSSRSYRPQVKDATGQWKDWLNTSTRGVRILGFSPANGSTEADPYAGVPGGTPATKTESTTNNSTASHTEKEDDNNVFPPGIRPPFPSDRLASPIPSSRYNRPRPKSTPQPKPPVIKKAVSDTPPSVIEPEEERPNIVSPEPTPEPIPVPEPPSEPTIEEVEQTTEETEPEPGIIDVTQTRRADGTIVTTTTREATSEEIEKFNKDLRDANRKLDNAKKTIEADRKFRFGDNYDGGIDTDTNLGSSPSKTPTEVVTQNRTSFGGVSFRIPSPPPQVEEEVDTEGSNTKTKDDKGKVPPEPDATPEPTPTPEPVVQNKVSDDPIVDKINKLPSKQDIALAVGGLDIIRQIAEKAGTASPVCLAPVLVPPVSAKVTANNQAILGFQALNTGQNAAIQTTVNAVNRTTNTIATGVTKVQGTLGKMQRFAETAWKVTRADKIMSGVTMALTVHNAMMLSNNLASTVSEAVNMTFNALNIRDETDKQIDIGGAIRTKISEVLSSVLGADNYAALTARTAKANRIYQASINLLDTTYSLFDSARTVAELTAENTGKIGNALRESCAVYEDAYEEMTEKINPQNASQRKLEKFREGLESVENVFDTVSQISGSVVETKENIQQIKEEKDNLIEEVNTEIETKKDEKDTAKTENQVTTDISGNDFDRGTAES